jgi:hypothetical protein
MGTYAGMEVNLYTFLISVLDGYDWEASSFGRFTPRYPQNRRLDGPHNPGLDLIFQHSFDDDYDNCNDADNNTRSDLLS